MAMNIKQLKLANRTENDIDRAVKNIYQTYGQDLLAFVRDVEVKLATERRESATGPMKKVRKRHHGG